MELWDAYDADFQKIAGRTLIRGEAVPEGEYHLCCVILVKHRDGTYLLMQRDPRKPLGGLWEASAGGAAQQGDTPEMCARRELREETGIEADTLTELGFVRFDGGRSFCGFYLVETDCGKDDIRLQEGETVAWRWVDAATLIAMNDDELATRRVMAFVEALRPCRLRDRADESLVIRRELASDRRAVEELTRQAFWNVNRPGCSEHFLAHALREHPDFLPELDFVMEERGELVGSIMFTRARLTAGDGEAKRALTFGPLSIRPDCQRRGLGKQLVRFALERARKLGFEAAVIFGNPENYVTSGFKGCRAYGVSLGGGVWPTALLVRELEEGALAGKEWVFQESAAYDIDEKAAEAFDRAFPPMEPAWRPSQELFAIYSRSRVIR